MVQIQFVCLNNRVTGYCSSQDTALFVTATKIRICDTSKFMIQNKNKEKFIRYLGGGPKRLKQQTLNILERIKATNCSRTDKQTTNSQHSRTHKGNKLL